MSTKSIGTGPWIGEAYGDNGISQDDQVRFSPWRAGWNYYAVPKDRSFGNKIANYMCQIVNNQNIGYSQGSRYTMYQNWLKTKDFDKITSRCYTDCSQCVATCIIAAGGNIPYSMTSSCTWDYLSASGLFDVGIASGTPTVRGTVVWHTSGKGIHGSGHVAMYLANSLDGCGGIVSPFMFNDDHCKTTIKLDEVLTSFLTKVNSSIINGTMTDAFYYKEQTDTAYTKYHFSDKLAFYADYGVAAGDTFGTAAAIAQFLHSKKDSSGKQISNYAIAGILGNIYQECTMDYCAEQHPGTLYGIGICQWSNPQGSSSGRHTNLVNYANSKGSTWKNLNIQLDFLWKELTENEHYAMALRVTNNQKSAEQSAYWWAYYFEYYNGGFSSGANISGRQQYARNYYNQMTTLLNYKF